MTHTAPLIVGHRGAPRRAKENTLEAFAAARGEGADGVELDVHRTADGVLVVHHDADAETVGVLAERSFAEVRGALAWLPTLAEVLDECRGILVNIEIKNSPGDADFDAGLAVSDLVVDLLNGREGDDVLVSSFHLPSIDRVHARDPAIATGYLAVLDPPPLDAIATAASGGHRAIHPFFGVLADRAAVTVVEGAHTLGLAVNTWTVNDAAEIRRLAAAGVDAIITDTPADARAALTG
jgi:glycerophosphoryl diester phosphodiesterase